MTKYEIEFVLSIGPYRYDAAEFFEEEDAAEAMGALLKRYSRQAVPEVHEVRELDE